MHQALKRRACFAMAGLFVLTGCGKRGALVYPDLLVPEAPQAVQLDQHGSSLLLSFSLPTKDRRGHELKEPFVLQVQRRELAPDERGECGDCPRDYQALQRIDPEYPGPVIRLGGRMMMLDSDVRHGKRYQYRLAAVTRQGDAGTAVETVRGMVCTVPAAPRITAKTLHGGIIALDFQAEVPDNAELVGFALYRAVADEPLPALPLATILEATHYLDQSVQPGVVYRYAARLVIRRWDDLLVFSELSPTLTTTLADNPQ